MLVRKIFGCGENRETRIESALSKFFYPEGIKREKNTPGVNKEIRTAKIAADPVIFNKNIYK
ncbi:MAG: hypothetical protein ACOY46_04145 [Bacillota bacterium]